MSIDGKLVYKDIISGNGLITKAINISDLSDGIYYLKLETKYYNTEIHSASFALPNYVKDLLANSDEE